MVPPQPTSPVSDAIDKIRATRENDTTHDKNAVTFAFRLYVTGGSAHSTAAITNATRLFNATLQGRYTLEIVDISQQPERAVTDQIVAVPTLVKTHPQPRRRVIGDLSNNQKVIDVLGLVDSSHAFGD